MSSKGLENCVFWYIQVFVPLFRVALGWQEVTG
jgi:hypothetical protein